MNKVSIAIALSMISLPAWATTRSVTLNVPGMTCPACPITIRTALSRVPGVSRVVVSFEKRQAVVTYDDAKTSVGKLIRVTTDAGYPSTARHAAN